MNRTLKLTLNIVLYVVAFMLIQFLTMIAVQHIVPLLGAPAALDGKMLVAISALSSVITLLVFIYARWATVSRVWLASHPWITLLWVVFLALGTILPSEWVQEQLQLTMPDALVEMFQKIMGEPSGYLAIGILAPLAEELVFRGAVLRTLLRLFPDRKHWIAIIISALIFGAVHGNVIQFIHAAAIGLLLGWLYYRTDSIVPGVAFHWVNNTVAYLMFNLMPQLADGKLIDLFHGNTRMMWLGLVFSLCMFLPSLFQLNMRLRRN